MNQGTKVRAIDVARLDIPLHTPFGISGGALPAANNVLVTVTLENGRCGYGEGAPLPAYNGETQSHVLAALKNVSAFCGREVSDWRKIGAEFRTGPGATCGAAQCALEMALIDALARHDGIPLGKFFGGHSSTLETDMTVTTGSAQEAAAAAKAIRARGIRVIKVKIGGKSGVAADLARLAAIHDVAPDSPLVLDGNAGVTRAEGKELVQGLKARGIVPALLEQWLAKDDLAGMRGLREESGWLVAADEAACSVADVAKIVHERAADVVNIKLMKAGVAEAMEIARAARRGRLELMIGGNVESILAMTFSACFAAGAGCFRFADLDTPLFLAENPFKGGYELNGGTISIAHIQAGHGVEPR